MSKSLKASRFRWLTGCLFFLGFLPKVGYCCGKNKKKILYEKVVQHRPDIELHEGVEKLELNGMEWNRMELGAKCSEWRIAFSKLANTVVLNTVRNI